MSIEEGKKSNVDHIIPKALFSKTAAERVAEFNLDWNLQPTHMECNESKDSQLHGWPQFNCKCHYLQVQEGNLYVVTRGAAGEGRYKLLDSIVSEEKGRADALLVIGSGMGTGDTPIAGYWEDRFGYVLPGIAESQVEFFNLRERGRVGLQVPKYVRLDDDGRVVGKWG